MLEERSTVEIFSAGRRKLLLLSILSTWMFNYVAIPLNNFLPGKPSVFPL
jgi:hypothetical protein